MFEQRLMHVIGFQVVRVLGEKGRTGWRPKRSLVFLSWGAEEYSLCGSRFGNLLSMLIFFNEEGVFLNTAQCIRSCCVDPIQHTTEGKVIFLKSLPTLQGVCGAV